MMPLSPNEPPMSSGTLSFEVVTSERRARVWAGLTAFVGVAFWAQLLLYPILGELAYSDGRPLAILVYLVPLALLGLGIWMKRSALLLMLFPLSLLPALALLPALDWASLSQSANTLWLVGTFAAYLAVSSARELSARPIEAGEPTRGKPSPRSGSADYQRFYMSRLMASMFILLVIVYALFFDRSTGANFIEYHGGEEQVARAFATVFMFFVWCVFVYMMILVPGANVEYDRRRLSRELEGLTSSLEPRRHGLRIGGWISGALLLALVAFWWM